MKNLQRSGGWSLTLSPEYSDLTKQWLNASEGLARPMVELRVKKDMPDGIWDTALEKILKGGGQPSFYNEEAIQKRLTERLPDVPKEDIYTFACMGCTETAFSGMTYCGGIDVNLNLLKILEECMKDSLGTAKDFDDFYGIFMKRVHEAQDRVMSYTNALYNSRAVLSFAPIRSLFTADCIEKEKGFYQGGARYTFSIPSDSGIPNTVDSLLAIKELVYGKGVYSPEEFVTALENGDVRLQTKLRSCPSYGAGNAEATALINDLTKSFYSYYRRGKLDLGLGFFPTSSQFQRHICEGKTVGATPDGRKSGQAVADSIAAMNGKALKGPTVMLTDAASFAQDEIYSTPVLNLSIARKFDKSVLRALIEGYFDMGGTQIQITCADKDTLLDAKKNPDAHRDLIVRIGGYSDFFCNISSDLQDAVIARTAFGN